MDEAWIINMQDMLNEKGEVKEMATPAKGVFEKMTKIISIATSQGVNSEISTGVRCLRFNTPDRCGGMIMATVDSDTMSILWECPLCGDHGIIEGWKGTPWDKT